MSGGICIEFIILKLMCADMDYKSSYDAIPDADERIATQQMLTIELMLVPKDFFIALSIIHYATAA